MPVYEYVCLDCKHRFDVLRSIKEADDPIQCNECESSHTSRMLSLFFAHSDGRAVTHSSNGGCASCGGGSCATCGH